ncbi:SRPBCC family protein [Mycobacterium sp.]|uniref:SRPBCC family protein n=1 Tax=Mycobacterium sp. TaxID=1785 RepID=UPI00338F5C2C
MASPGGVGPTVDRVSLGLVGGLPHRTASYRRYLREHRDEIAKPLALTDVDADDYDAVFYPGGHAPMEDLAYEPVSGALLCRRLASGKPVALLCHAPAAALAAENADGTWPFAGYRMTALSNTEERLNRLSRKAPWLLEDRLIERGADYVKGALPLRHFITVDRNLYTGQNPSSSRALARKLVLDVDGGHALATSASRLVKASPSAVYAVISDITTMGQRSPETHSARWIEPDKRFTGKNRIGPWYRWSMRATVTEASPGKAFSFRTDWPSSTSWRYALTPVDEGTLVTESMSRDTPQLAPVRWIQRAAGVADRRKHLRSGIETSLQRLAGVVESRSTGL